MAQFLQGRGGDGTDLATQREEQKACHSHGSEWCVPTNGNCREALGIAGESCPKTGKNGPQMAQNFLQLGNKTACQSCNPLKSLKSRLGPLFGSLPRDAQDLIHPPSLGTTGRQAAIGGVPCGIPIT